jgi:hypothetical protein
MGFIISAENRRAEFNYANAHTQMRLNAAGSDIILGNNGATISPGYLRSEVVLNANVNTYTFGINDNDLYNGQRLFPSERRLKNQDSFYVGAMGYFLNYYTTQGGSTAFRSQYATHPKGQWQNPNDIVNFWEALWDAVCAIKVNNVPIIPNWDVRQHYNAPQTMYPVFATPVATQQYVPNDQQDGATDGYVPVQPMLLFDGGYNNVVEIKFDNALNGIFLPTAPGELRLVMRFYGQLVQNVSKTMVPGIPTPVENLYKK